MEDIIKALSGKKTYALCSIGFGLIALVILDYVKIPQEQLSQLIDAVTLAAIAALRAGAK